jgi:Fic-DOC domain mobile mystery protein B
MKNELFPFQYPAGSTPLDPNEIQGLLQSYVSTQAELNSLEQSNILEAQTWALRQTKKNILTDTFLLDLHKRMFKNVWKWAGTYRLTDNSIGVHWQQIAMQVSMLLQDTDYWIENKIYKWDELGARFHHKLVAIHPFPNGNGRHARLATEVLLTVNGESLFTWGQRKFSGDLYNTGDLRKEYIAALQEADQRRYSRLIAFVRS